MSIEERYEQALRLAADLAGENHRLAKELEISRNAHGDALIERSDALDLLAMCQDEAAELGLDLDDLQAEWAKDASSKAAGLSLFSTELTTAQNRKHSELALADARIAELEALDRQQVAHVDELVAENERLSVANEHQRASLDRLDSLLLERTREYAAVHNELLEERRLRVAAFERNAELEARTLDLNNQTGGAEAQRTHEAADALQAIIRKQTDGELIRSLHGVLNTLRGPQAPSVPRRVPA
jgi:hypothetical protein